MFERTLVIVKPDGYARGLTGTIIHRFEQRELRIDHIRISRNEESRVDSHYPKSETWLASVGRKTLDDYASNNLSALELLGTEDALAIGTSVRGWLIEFLLSGPIVPMIVSGNRAIETVRKVVGATLPVAAIPGTIRGDYSSDSPDLANSQMRPVKNLVHASGDAAEAEREIDLWFPEA